MAPPARTSIIEQQKTAKGQETTYKIIKEAYELLAEEGAANFSMLAVAKRVGIARGNLQYYFPLQKDLITALLYDYREQVKKKHALTIDDKSKEPRKRYETFIDWVLSNQQDVKDTAVIWNIWAMAIHDKELTEILKGHYGFFIDLLAEMLIDINPKTSKNAAEAKAGVLISLLEGSSLILQKNGKAATQKNKTLIKTLKQTAMDIAGIN